MEQVWTKSKVLIKGLVIGVLVLLLLIPTFSVQNLIAEREARQKQAIAEVSSKWAGAQNVVGPILVIPYVQNGTDATGKATTTKHYAYFLPDELSYQSTIVPQQRSRGIYKVMLYTTQVHLAGNFKTASLEKLKIPEASVLWPEAYVAMGLSDLKGLNEEVQLKWNDSTLTFAPQSGPAFLQDGLAAGVPTLDEKGMQNISFSAQINLNGSEELSFTPLGKTTTVQLSSKWPHPSFTGSILPQQSTVTEEGFTGAWKSLAHNRNFPQYWTDVSAPVNQQGQSGYQVDESAFGVDLIIPVNDYQKTMRSVKYAVLCILLTFAAFFIIETTNKKSVHPFQYGLIGLALILFYVLLLSVSEYAGFNIAYAVASVATIGLIGWFVSGILDSRKLSGFLSFILLLIYVYVFTVLQLQDFALLLGSIGLFISLATIMHFSRSIKW